MDEEAAAREDVAPSGTRLLILLLFIVVIVLILFVSFIILSLYFMPVTWLPRVPPDVIAARGQFGDMFGFITALFTGLGFAGIAVTLLAQWRTLTYQSRDFKRREQEAISREQSREQERLEREQERLERTRQQTEAQHYLAEQIRLLKESTDAETSAVHMQRSATSMDILTRMRETFDSKELRKSRHVASTFFLDAQKSDAGKRTPEPAQDTAIRDILSFFEQMAHFTNHSGIDEDMVLNAFYIRLEAYYYFAEKSVLPADHASSVAWAEIRKLREKGPEWLKREYVTQGLFESKDLDVDDETVQRHTDSDALIRVLKRESVRCKEA